MSATAEGGAGVGATGSEPGAGLGAAGASLVGALTARFANLAELAAFETRLAALSAMAMVVTTLLAAASLLAAWGLALAVLLAYAPAAGVSWPAAAALLVPVHAVAAIAFWRKTVTLSRALGLPAFRQAVADRDDAADTDLVRADVASAADRR